MQILIGLLVAAAGAFWAFRYFTDAAREGREAVRDVKGFFRSGKWSRKIDQRLIEHLADPAKRRRSSSFKSRAMTAPSPIARKRR